MAKLAIETKKLHFQLEQVQDFTPTPMTLATEIYYTGYHPYTLEKKYIQPVQKNRNWHNGNSSSGINRNFAGNNPGITKIGEKRPAY